MEMLNIIKKVKNATGNDKISVLKSHPEIKKILEYSYNPFKRFYLTSPEKNGSEGGCFFDDLDWKIFDDLSSRQLSGNSALEKVQERISHLKPGDAEVFKMILNKDLRCGINRKTINKAFPDLIPFVYDGSEKPPVMLLENFNPKKAKYPVLAAIKKDGVRGRNFGEMISRNGRKLIGHTHIEEELEKYPHDFDGELCVPGYCFDEASGLIRSDDPTPSSIYWVFDVPSIVGSKKFRYEWLVKNLVNTNHIKLVKHYLIKNEKALYKFYKWALDNGAEGIVIYDPESEYEDKRSYDWTRLVPIKSADCEVVGFFEGKGKWVGMLGGVIVDYEGHEVRVGTGFSEKVQLKQLVSQVDKELFSAKSKKLIGYSIEEIAPIWWNNRQFIWDNKDLFLNVTLKVEFKEKTKAGSMRHPRYGAWRWDK